MVMTMLVMFLVVGDTATTTATDPTVAKALSAPTAASLRSKPCFREQRRQRKQLVQGGQRRGGRRPRIMIGCEVAFRVGRRTHPFPPHDVLFMSKGAAGGYRERESPKKGGEGDSNAQAVEQQSPQATWVEIPEKTFDFQGPSQFQTSTIGLHSIASAMELAGPEGVDVFRTAYYEDVCPQLRKKRTPNTISSRHT